MSPPARPFADIVWLGTIPDGWERTRIKYVARSGRNTFVDGDWIETPFITDAGIRLLQCGNVGTGVFEEQGFRYITERTFKELNCTEVFPGDILICRLQSSRTILAGRSCRAPDLGPRMVTSVDNCIVKPSKDFDARFVVYLLSTQGYLSYIEAIARGGTRDRISRSMLGEIEIAAPDTQKQHAIADFLDRKTAQIDALIGKKQRQIELLQEKRQALVSEAVSGREGMTELKLGLLIELLPGFAFRSDGFSQAEDDIRLLRGVNVGIGSIQWKETVRWPRTEVTSYSEYLLRPGDLVLGMDRPWISTGIRLAQITEADTPSLLLQRVARLRARRGITQAYLKLLLSSIQFKSYFEPILTGVSVPHISPEQILSFRFRLPELDEQQDVFSSIEEETTRIERMTIKLNETIDKLREYRQAFITAAVTGKLDVRSKEGGGS